MYLNRLETQHNQATAKCKMKTKRLRYYEKITHPYKFTDKIVNLCSHNAGRFNKDTLLHREFFDDFICWVSSLSPIFLITFTLWIIPNVIQTI